MSAREALARIGVEVPVAEPVPEPVGAGVATGTGERGVTPRPRREKKPQGLPMPVMPADKEAER